jgi:hypothetical protein
MSNLRTENKKKCFALLREFIDEARGVTGKKGIAVLALNHLQTIMAGTPGGEPSTNGSIPSCTVVPRIDGSPGG